jgi:hypothetical protein
MPFTTIRWSTLLLLLRNLPSWRIRGHRLLHVVQLGLLVVRSHALRQCHLTKNKTLFITLILVLLQHAVNSGCSSQGAPLPGVSESEPSGHGRNSLDRSASSGLGLDLEDTSGSSRICGRGARKTAVGDSAAQCCAAAPAQWSPGELPAR